MTPEAQRIAIAKACGWTDIDVQGEYCFGTQPARSELDARQFMMELPHYYSDLNAMHEAEMRLTHQQHLAFRKILWDMVITRGPIDTWDRQYSSASASERAEAFLRTLNLWMDDA